MGRPSTLTPEITEGLVQAFSRGQTSIDSACALVGIGKSTYHRWMAQGAEQEKGQYRDFRDAIEKARAGAVQTYLEVIHKAAVNGTWQAAAWWLERVLPEQYGRKTTVETISRDALIMELERMEAELATNDPET